MVDPFTAWLRLIRAGAEIQATWIRGTETVGASNQVIAARTAKIAQAIASPRSADVAELARIVPEKMEAFSVSGASLSREIFAMQAAWFSQAQRLGEILMASGTPASDKAVAIASRSSDYLIETVESGARLGKGALAPVHKKVAANTRRLRAKR